MATVFLGALEGAHGFRQIVAIKRPHPHLLDDSGFRDARLREARLASGIHHANVVDFVRATSRMWATRSSSLMDYIEGASLGEPRRDARERRREAAPARRRPASCSMRAPACMRRTRPPTNCRQAARARAPRHVAAGILVGVDGVARVTDFGIAKCVETSDGTSRNALKGKAGYMAPEYVRGGDIDRRTDVFARGVVLWEALCGRRLFQGQTDAETARAAS